MNAVRQNLQLMKNSGFAKWVRVRVRDLIILKCMDLEEFELFARNIGHIVIFFSRLRCKNALEGTFFYSFFMSPSSTLSFQQLHWLLPNICVIKKIERRFKCFRVCTIKASSNNSSHFGNGWKGWKKSSEINCWCIIERESSTSANCRTWKNFTGSVLLLLLLLLSTTI